MEEVFLSSDVLIAYFGQPVGEGTERHEQATAIMHPVYAGELTVHLTDITLYEVLRFLLEVDVSDLDEELYEEHRQYFIREPHTSTEYFRERARRYLLPLIDLPNVILRDKERWGGTLSELIIGVDWRRMPLYIEAAYNASAYALLDYEALRKVQGIVSFEHLTTNYGFPRIDPAEFQ